MDDDLEVSPSESEPLNWADVLMALLAVPLGLVKGLDACLTTLQAGLLNTSRAHDERAIFRRTAGVDIEAITEGKDG